MDAPNGTPPQQPQGTTDPQKIATEVYLLDLLLASARLVAAQCRLRGKMMLAEQLEHLVVMCGPGQAKLLQQVREDLHLETYGKTPAGLVLP
jgi:hypothetical protein